VSANWIGYFNLASLFGFAVRDCRRQREITGRFRAGNCPPRPVSLRNVGGRNFVLTIAIDCKDWAALRRCREEVELLSHGSMFHFRAGGKIASFSGRRPPKPVAGDIQKVNTSDEAVPHSGTTHGGSVDRIAVRWRSRERHRGEHRNRSYMHSDWNIPLGGSMDNVSVRSATTLTRS
jgi:hypothetical protein